MEETKTNDEQRGKRKSAFRHEVLAAIVLGLAIADVGDTGDIFSLVFPALLTYSAALRGLDARWPSGRV